MADNVTADPGSGGATFKTDEDTGASAHVPITKIELGANNSFDGYVSAANPMPSEISDGTNTVGVLVDDTTTHATGSTTGLALFAAATPTDGAVDANDMGAVAMSTDRRLLTDTQIVGQDAALDVSAATVTVSGTVTADAGTGPFPVSDNGGSLTVDTTADATDGSPHGASQTGFRAMGTDGTNDQQIAVDATGNLQVDIVADAAGLATAANQLPDGHNVTVDNAAGTNSVPVQGDAAENAPVTGNPVLSGGRYDLTPRTLGDGDVGAIALDPDGAVHISDGGNTITVDGTVTTTPSGTQNVDVTANTIGLATSANQLPDGHNVTVDNAAGASAVNVQDGGNSLTVDWNGTAPPIGAGTEAAALRVTLATDSTGVVSVDDNNSSLTVDNSSLSVVGGGTEATAMRVTLANDSTGVLSVDDNNSSLTVDQATASSLNAQVVGNIAHDGVDAGNPIKIGGRAVAHGATPTAVAVADRTDLLTNRVGIPFIIGGHPNVVTFEAAYTAAQTDTAIVTVATGAKIVVTQIQATCDNANTVDVGLRVGFGTANTPTTTGVVLTHPGIAAGSGVSRGDGSGIIGVGADDADLRITSEVPTGGSLRILVSYYTVSS